MTKPNTNIAGDTNVVAARIAITPALELRVVVQPFQQKRFLHIREYALASDNAFVPTPKGVTAPLDQLVPVLDAVRDLRGAGAEEGVVAVVPGTGGSEIHFAISRWMGGVKADIRQYFRASNGDVLPTRKGVRINIGLLAEIERGLEALDRQITG